MLLMLAVACGDGGGEPASPPTGPEEPASLTPETVTAPLTGEEVDDASVLDRPVIAVKVENSPSARPQSGLDVADIVFEEITEGGVTRFLTLFQSDVPDLVGPIRSGRPEDSEVLPAYHAMLFISGARPDVLAGLRAAGVDFRTEDGEVLSRDPRRNAPHNVYARGDELFEAATGEVRPADPVPWEFSEEPPGGAVPCPDPCEDEPGGSISIEMSGQSVSGFTYDADAGVYRREQNGVPLTVTGSGRIGAANVLVLATDVVQVGCCDPAGNPLNATEVVGKGRALLLRDGRLYVGGWVKGSPGSHILVTGPDSQPLAFKPGSTWALFAPERGVPTVDASSAAG